MELNNENIKKVFDSIDFDMFNDAYEQFKEDEVGNQGKRMGQYFTPRSIIRHCIEKLDHKEQKQFMILLVGQVDLFTI